MKVLVKVKLKAKKNQAKRIDEAHFEIAVKEPPVRGRANKTVIRLLAEYFSVRQSAVSIIAGLTSRQKVVQIEK